MFRTQHLCTGSKNVFDSRQEHFCFPRSKICFRNTFPVRLNWEIFASATMFPSLARPLSSLIESWSKDDVNDNARKQWSDWLNEENNRAARAARTSVQFFDVVCQMSMWNFNIWAFKAWFPCRCICRICRVSRTKKIHRTDITLWKPPVQMLNTKETTDTTCCTR